MTDPVLCPDCGWTGTTDDVEPDREELECPVCATDIEFVD